ncbi:MAG TPA: hypothetical protein VG225_17850 [Terracidiphilus sp.]|jgi:hypothetical protein|nr:hypothetical protein [Terracidiphilus sp.]
MKRLASILLCYVSVAAAMPRAAAPALSPAGSPIDLSALFAHMNTAMQSNGKLAQQYTSDELWHNLNYNKSGKLTDDESARYENVFVEGLPYRRKVEQNGKPLTGKAAEQEEARYEKAVRERRSLSLQQKRSLFHFTAHYSWPLCCLATLFDNRILRRELVNGRDIVVVESTPKPGAHPANDHEKTSLDWKETTWIDVAEAMPARIEVESLTDTPHMEKGATNRLDFIRIADTSASTDKPASAVWLESHFLASFHFKVMWVNLSGSTEQTWSNFKKFRVDMRLLENTVEEITPPTH